jgi:hypothetical protein
VALSEADFVNYRELDRTVPSVAVRNARDINSKYNRDTGVAGPNREVAFTKGQN